MNTLIELKTLLIAINYIRYLDCLTITYLTTCMPTYRLCPLYLHSCSYELMTDKSNEEL